MSAEAQRSSRVERFGSRGGAIFVLFCPALLWAGQYVGQPDFQHYYRHLLHSLPIWVPVLALFWIAAVLRLFWPERLPGPLPSNSNHMRTALMLGRGLFWGAAIGLMGALVAAFADQTRRALPWISVGS